MKSKTILIERVSNGWIVRPFQPCQSWACEENPAIAVFTSMQELQEALPRLLWPEGTNDVTVS